MLEEGALLLERCGEGAEGRARAIARCGRRRCATRRRSHRRAAHRRTRRSRRRRCSPTFADPTDHHADEVGAAVGRPERARRSAPGTSCSPVAKAASRARRKRLAGDRRHGLRRRVPAARSTRSARTYRKGRGQHPRRRARRPRQPVGHRLGGRRPHRDRTPTSAPSTTSTPSSPRPRAHGIEVALDYALQCSPDHPWVREHPEWFHHRPDGSIRTPRTRPRSTRTSTRSTSGRSDEPTARALWEACKDDPRPLDRPRRAHLPGRQPAHQAVRVLGVADRRRAGRAPRRALPGRGVHPPEVMAKLAEVGFTQSYTYFTWRTTQLGARASTSTELAPRPDWPTTCGRTSGPTRPTSSPARCATGRRPRSRCGCVLAATLAPSYGIYWATSCARTSPRRDDNEEYLALREVRAQARATGTQPDSLAPFITPVNAIRRAPPGVRRAAHDPLPPHRQRRSSSSTRRPTPTARDVVLVRREPRPRRRAGGHAVARPRRPRARRGTRPFEVHDELTGATYTWHGPDPYVRLDPAAGSRGPRPRACARLMPAGQRSTSARRRPALVPAGGLLRGPRPRVLRLQRRRHRRPPGPHREARLPRVARRRLPLAAALLPVAAARRRLRHLRLLHRAPRLRRRRATPPS